MNEDIGPWAKHWGHCKDLGLGSDPIEARSYTSQEIYDAEVAKVFRKTWVAIARTSEIPAPGDFIKRHVATFGTELLIVRGQDDVIRTFYNACPHRGVALVRQDEGSARMFVCPYHAWSYSTDGKLRAIPGAAHFCEVDKTKVGLRQVNCDTWNEHIFVHMDDDPQQTLLEYLGEFGDLFSDLPFSDYKHAVDVIQDLPTNWKNFIDAFNEGYHVSVLHSKTLPMVPTKDNPLNHFYDPILLSPHSSTTIQSNLDWAPKGDVMKFVYSSAGRTMIHVEGGDQQSEIRLFTSARGVNRIGLPNFSTTIVNLFPLSQFMILADRYMWFQFWPIGPDKTRFVARMYFDRAPTSYLDQFAESYMISANRDVMIEDVSITRLQQIGMSSGGLNALILGDNEHMIRHFHEVVRGYLTT